MTLCIQWNIDWTAITALATIGLLIVTAALAHYGWKQFVTLNTTSKEDALTNK